MTTIFSKSKVQSKVITIKKLTQCVRCESLPAFAATSKTDFYN